MKFASKFIAALAVVASVSSFAQTAAGPELIDTSELDDTATLETSIGLAGDGSTSNAVIFQTKGSSAVISQIGENGASIIQIPEGSNAAIVQSDAGNIAVIFQGE